MRCLSCSDARVKEIPAIKGGGDFEVAKALKAPTVTGVIYRCVCNRQFDKDDILRSMGKLR